MRLSRAFMLSLCLLAAACGIAGPDDGDVPDELLGTWFATVLMVNGADLAAADGTTLQLTFNANNTVAVVVTNDLDENICDVGPGCSQSDTYTATTTEIVFSPEDMDPLPFAIELTSTALRMVGNEEGRTLDWTLGREPPRGPPTVTISEPTAAVALAPGAPVTLAATASDHDGTDLTTVIEWTSDIDGPLDVGGEITASLSTGAHMITATAQDLLTGRDGLASVAVTMAMDVPADLLGSWVATALLFDATDLIVSQGTTLQLTFNADNTFSVVATNDVSDSFCDPGPSCSDSGASYSARQTQIVFDYLEADPVARTALSLDVTPTVLRIVGSSRGVAMDWSFVR